ncbi:hypothetical protein LTR78_007602 [Recurvomyces mirabilis]|uniref:Uncharacterized protein n=1 Tax=Recurvomyces mirabilis TaxID=574656 RepID=A0AAE0TVD0_9PEZI|nr:hypothetical protein LTR78_007602 [Recurvomyces mirabilis]KAK5159887.1 hypothetical protein LTS14_001992 [Recurvomyces mirabilis]
MRSIIALVLLAMTWRAIASYTHPNDVLVLHTPTRTTNALVATPVYSYSSSDIAFQMTGPTTAVGNVQYEVLQHHTTLAIPTSFAIPTLVQPHQFAALSAHIDRAAITSMLSHNKPYSCDKKDHRYNDTICVFQKCMSKFRDPIYITTVFTPAHCNSCGWLTRQTTLTGNHWGVVDRDCLYYPSTLIVTTDRLGTESAVPSVTIPRKDKRIRVHYHDPPSCWSKVTCAHECLIEARDYRGFWDMRDTDNWRTMAPYVFWAGFWLLLSSLFSCCCCCLPCRSLRRKQRQNIEKPTETTEEVVTTTETADTADQGTLGRRAEEGRGQVHFAEPAETATGAGGSQVFTTHAGGTVVTAPAHAVEHVVEEAPKATEKVVSVPVEAAEHVETVAAHDGTAEVAEAVNTGSEMADMNSMRGRKRTKQSRGDVLNLRF